MTQHGLFKWKQQSNSEVQQFFKSIFLQYYEGVTVPYILQPLALCRVSDFTSETRQPAGKQEEVEEVGTMQHVTAWNNKFIYQLQVCGNKRRSSQETTNFFRYRLRLLWSAWIHIAINMRDIIASPRVKCSSPHSSLSWSRRQQLAHHFLSDTVWCTCCTRFRSFCPLCTSLRHFCCWTITEKPLIKAMLTWKKRKDFLSEMEIGRWHCQLHISVFFKEWTNMTA